jgi:hypothetical protein
VASAVNPPEQPEGAGSFAEESARLLSALQDWAAKGRVAASAHVAGAHEIGVDEADGETGVSGAGHSPECAVCPLCQGIRLVRDVRPEVVAHLSDAATSFLSALAALFPPEAAEPARGERATAQHIDVVGDEDAAGGTSGAAS